MGHSAIQLCKVKHLIFSLSGTVEALETRCEELQRHLEEAETRMRDRKEKRRSFLLIDQETEDGNCSVRKKNNEFKVISY